MSVRTRSCRAAASALLATGLVIGVAGPASAERLSRSDPRGDVVRYEEIRRDRTAPRTEHPGPETRPKRRMGDIRRTLVRHTKEKVILRSKYARLTRKQGNPYTAAWMFRNEADEVLSVSVMASPGQWSGQLVVSKPSVPVPARIPAEPCGTHKISYQRDVIRVVMPRECLDAPLSFRVATWTRFFKDNTVFLDDGLRDGVLVTPEPDPELELKWSRRLSPG